MKEDTKKSTAKSKVKIKDIAPKKDAKGGFSSAAAKPSSQASLRAGTPQKGL